MKWIKLFQLILYIMRYLHYYMLYIFGNNKYIYSESFKNKNGNVLKI